MVKLLRVAGAPLANRKGPPVPIRVALILVRSVATFLPPCPVVGWLAETDLLLAVGVSVALIGVLLDDALQCIEPLCWVLVCTCLAAALLCATMPAEGTDSELGLNHLGVDSCTVAECDCTPE